MLEVLIVALLERVDKQSRNQLLSLVLRWQNSDNMLLKIALADLMSILPRFFGSAQGEKTTDRFKEFVPVLKNLVQQFEVAENDVKKQFSKATKPWKT